MIRRSTLLPVTVLVTALLSVLASCNQQPSLITDRTTVHREGVALIDAWIRSFPGTCASHG